MATGDEFFALLTERLPAVQVQGWLRRDGEELYRAVARVFETASERSVAEIRAARVLLATFAGKAVGTITITWDAATFYPYTVPTGTVVARTAWGVEYVLTEDIVRTAGQPAGSQSYEVEARWAGFEGNVDAGFVLEFADGVPGTFSLPVPAKYLLRSDGASGSYAVAHNNKAARVVFSGTGVPVCSVVFWARNVPANYVFVIGDASDTQPRLAAFPEGDLGVEIADAVASSASTFATPDPADSSFHGYVVTVDGASIAAWGDGANDGGSVAATGTYAAADALRLLDIISGGGESAGDIAAFAIFDRTLSSAEIAALYAAGPTWDLTLPTGAYATPDPAILYDGAADFGSVPNRGSAGSCDLDLNGGVSTVLLAAATTVEHSELTDRIAAGTIRITASSAMVDGSPGTLDLLARGAGLPVAEGETAAQVRRKLRGAPDIVTPTGVRAAVVALLGTEDVTTVEPWDGTGFAWGVSGWGLAAWMRSVWFAIVLVPAGTDTDVVQVLVNRVRAFGYTVLVLESA